MALLVYSISDWRCDSLVALNVPHGVQANAGGPGCCSILGLYVVIVAIVEGRLINEEFIYLKI